MKERFQLIQILGLLGMYFDAWVVEVEKYLFFLQIGYGHTELYWDYWKLIYQIFMNMLGDFRVVWLFEFLNFSGIVTYVFVGGPWWSLSGYLGLLRVSGVPCHRKLYTDKPAAPLHTGSFHKYRADGLQQSIFIKKIVNFLIQTA